MPHNSNIERYIQASQAELERLDREIQLLQQRREIEVARLEAFRLAGAPVIKSPPVERIDGTTRVAAQVRDRRPRAPAGLWKEVFRRLLGEGVTQFDYDAVVTAANNLGIEASKPSTRVRVSKFKNAGYLDSVKEGVFYVTEKGKAYFSE